MILKGHVVNNGVAEGEAVVYKGAFSFLGDLDPRSGKVPIRGHELEGKSLAGKVFVFTTGKGSAGGPLVAHDARKRGNAPAAMICLEAEPVIVSGAIMADIPMVDKLDKNPLEVISTGDYIKVDADKGIVEIIKRRSKDEII